MQSLFIYLSCFLNSQDIFKERHLSLNTGICPWLQSVSLPAYPRQTPQRQHFFFALYVGGFHLCSILRTAWYSRRLKYGISEFSAVLRFSYWVTAKDAKKCGVSPGITLFLGNCKITRFLVTYFPYCCYDFFVVANHTSFMLCLQTSGRSNIPVYQLWPLYVEERIMAQNSTNVLFIKTLLDSQSVYGCKVFKTERNLHYWNYLNFFKVFNFRQHLWLAKRKTNFHVAGIVAYYPTFTATWRPQSESFLHKTCWR